MKPPAEMSRASFPRPEHAALLLEKIAEDLGKRPLRLELASRGLDHYRCCYRFGVRPAGEGDWKEFAVHFQVAQRLENNAGEHELRQMLELFLDRHFPGAGAHQEPSERMAPGGTNLL
ncbi:MAG TPA: hypothetical protein VNN17_05550 [Terriglobia bacterium]|nr:hypothetical protein [Terriglobia bacterium]